MRNRQTSCVVLVCIVCALSVFNESALAASGIDPYRLIRRVRSPGELVSEQFPRSYCVPVKVSGKVAEQLQNSVSALNLKRPRLVETLDKGSVFRLKVDNPGYPAETRELLSGMINISDMVERVLSSVVKYKKESQLQLLRSHTVAELDKGDPGTGGRCDILFTPRGDRFGYEYLDMGNYVYETWLRRMRISMDTARNLVYSVEMEKVYTGSMVRKTGADSVLHKRIEYRMNYDTVDGTQIPRLLQIFVNGEQQLKIQAAYRMLGSDVVFDSKEICYFTSGGESAGNELPSCLKMEYGNYRKGSASCIQHVGTKVSPRRQHKKLAYAGTLARKAREAMDRGDIHKASRILKKIVRHCPDTPQGIEAKNILSVFPGY